MRKIVSLLLALVMVLSVSCASAIDVGGAIGDVLDNLLNQNTTSPEESITGLMSAVKTIYDKEEIPYTPMEGYEDSCLVTVMELTDSRLGDMYLYSDCYEDSRLLTTNYDEVADPAVFDEMIKLFNYVNGDLFWGKLYLLEESGDMCYEVCLPMNGAALTDQDKVNISEFAFTCMYICDLMVEYISAVMNGETGANAFAMYVADIYAE